MKAALVCCLVIVFVGCKRDPNFEIISKKFNSMGECLSSITRNTRQPLRVVNHKIHKVTGFIGETDLQFYCYLKKTGTTEGTYVNGWYQQEKKR